MDFIISFIHAPFKDVFCREDYTAQKYTNNMKQSPSEAYSRSATQETCRLLGTRTFIAVFPKACHQSLS
jgi:hypothetical protein